MGLFGDAANDIASNVIGNVTGVQGTSAEFALQAGALNLASNLTGQLQGAAINAGLNIANSLTGGLVSSFTKTLGSIFGTGSGNWSSLPSALASMKGPVHPVIIGDGTGIKNWAQYMADKNGWPIEKKIYMHYFQLANKGQHWSQWNNNTFQLWADQIRSTPQFYQFVLQNYPEMIVNTPQTKVVGALGTALPALGSPAEGAKAVSQLNAQQLATAKSMVAKDPTLTLEGIAQAMLGGLVTAAGVYLGGTKTGSEAIGNSATAVTDSWLSKNWWKLAAIVAGIFALWKWILPQFGNAGKRKSYSRSRR